MEIQISIMRITIIFILVFTTSISLAQKKPKRALLESKTEIEEYVQTELELSMEGPEGELFLFGKEYGIKGFYTFDLTITNKGEIVTVFAVNSENSTINSQNNLKDYLRSEYQFKTFKTVKGKKYKIQYTFKFD